MHNTHSSLRAGHDLMIANIYIAPQMSQMCNLLWSIQQPHKLGFIIIPILQMRKLEAQKESGDFTKVSADKW